MFIVSFILQDQIAYGNKCREASEAPCRFEWVTKESAKTLAEIQNYLTTKDTKEPADERLIPPLCLVTLTFILRTLQLEPNAILRVLRALRGEFSLASVPR
jgi:hypothetical protein